MEYLKLIVEFISATIWPLTLLFLLLYFKNNVNNLLKVLVKRFENASQVEFPGGFKALFYQEKKKSVKQIAEEAINAVSEDFTDVQKNNIKKQIETALLSEEAPLIVLSHISSFGLVAIDRLYSFAEEMGLKNTEIDSAIDRLLHSGYITKKDGALHVTYEGVNLLRFEERKPKLTRRST